MLGGSMVRKTKRGRNVPSRMDDCLWSKLPTELLDRVLPFLQVPDLCRFRSVCKRWNSLMRTPEFGNLCAQTTRKVASAGACLVFQFNEENPRAVREAKSPGWGIFDLTMKRWYNIKRGTILSVDLSKDFNHNEYVQDVDRGLVCTVCCDYHHFSRIGQDVQKLVVSNLIDGTFKILPSPPLAPWVRRIDWVMNRSSWKLVVDEVSNTYSIFIVTFPATLPVTQVQKDDPCMCVYNSSTNQWRTVTNPPNTRLGFGRNYLGRDFAIHIVVIQELLYVLVSSSSGTINRLYSFNCLEDCWEDTGVHFRHGGELDSCSLVVSDNRLFLMTQLNRERLLNRPPYQTLSDLKKRDCPLRISEISLVDKACRKPILQVTEAQVMKAFNITGKDHHKAKIEAFGFDSSILLMCHQTGKVIQCGQIQGDRLREISPTNPAEGHLETQAVFFSKLGMFMNKLSLPNIPW